MSIRVGVCPLRIVHASKPKPKAPIARPWYVAFLTEIGLEEEEARLREATVRRTTTLRLKSDGAVEETEE
jgi:hypothetical protein